MNEWMTEINWMNDFSTSLLGNTEKKRLKLRREKNFPVSFIFLSDWLTDCRPYILWWWWWWWCWREQKPIENHSCKQQARSMTAATTKRRHFDIFFLSSFLTSFSMMTQKKNTYASFFSGNHNNHIFVCVCVWIIIIWSDTGYPLVYPRRVIWNLPD